MAAAAAPQREPQAAATPSPAGARTALQPHRSRSRRQPPHRAEAQVTQACAPSGPLFGGRPNQEQAQLLPVELSAVKQTHSKQAQPRGASGPLYSRPNQHHTPSSHDRPEGTPQEPAAVQSPPAPGTPPAHHALAGHRRSAPHRWVHAQRRAQAERTTQMGARSTPDPLDRRSAERQVDQEPRDSLCNGQMRPLGPGERF